MWEIFSYLLTKFGYFTKPHPPPLITTCPNMEGLHSVPTVEDWDNRGSMSFHDGASILVGQAKKCSVLYRLSRFGDIYLGIIGVGRIGEAGIWLMEVLCHFMTEPH